MRRAFTFVGRIDSDKGIQHVIDAWLRLTEYSNALPLWIVGGLPSEIDELRRTVGPERLAPFESSGRLHWWGYLDAAGVSAVLLRSAVLVTHSRYEPGGRVVLEAMSEGLPVIATPHGFAFELVRDWATGFLVPFGDIALLARRMEHFVRQPYLRNALGHEARAVATQALDAWRFVDQHCNIYDDVVAQRSTTYILDPPTIPDDKEFFDHRKMAVTYPLEATSPSDDDVKRFFANVFGIAPISVGLGRRDTASSTFWDLSYGNEHWLAKYAYPRLEVRPIWDPSRPEPLVSSAHQRYDIEVFSATLRGFAPFVARDPERFILLRQSLPQPKLGKDVVDILRQLRGPLDELHQETTIDFRGVAPLASINWRVAARDEVDAGLGRLAVWIAESDAPWHPGHHVSLPLSWRILELDIASQRLPLPVQWHHGDRAALAQLMEVDGEVQPIVLCHGSPHARHFVRHDNLWQLIDGENLHPGEASEDLAYLVMRTVEYCRKREIDEGSLANVLRSIARGAAERRRVLSWCGLIVLEGLCRQTYFGRQRSADKYLQLWSELRSVMAATK